MFLITLEYTAPLEKLDEHLGGHRELLHDGIAKKVLVFAGRKVPRTGGLFLLNYKTRAEVDAFIARDPYFTEKLATYAVQEIQVTVPDPRFEVFLK
jgi:uncharacterized protein YciI